MTNLGTKNTYVCILSIHDLSSNSPMYEQKCACHVCIAKCKSTKKRQLLPRFNVQNDIPELTT